MVHFILWSEAFGVGNKTIDEQHLQIVDILNELYAAKGDVSQVAPKHVMAQLKRYTETHFAYEEELMRAARYSDLESHAKIHSWMTRKTRELAEHVIGNPDTLTNEVFDFLKKWWVSHIREIDTRYAPYISPQN